jgi:hypothetical protein
VASEIHRSDETPEVTMSNVTSGNASSYLCKHVTTRYVMISTGYLVTSNLLKKYCGKVLNKSEKRDLIHTLIFHPLKKNG